MKTKTKRNLLIALVLVLVIAVPVCGYFLYTSGQNNVEKALAELLALPETTTAQDLEKEGYVNLTQVQEGRLGKVNSFFAPAEASKKMVLKAFYETEDDLVACVFLKLDGARLTYLTSYAVKDQAVTAQNRSLHLMAEEVSGPDGITEVWLRGRTADVNQPDGEDFLLYRYRG